MDAVVTSSAVAKRLASCNKATRDRALRLLKTWLSAQAPASAVSGEDLLKIWKGLFYCVWHADKLPVQSELVNRLASLLVSLDAGVAGRYLEAFVATIRREWSGIDHLRMDKFYLLIRRFLHHLFLLLSKSAWDRDLSVRMFGVLSEKSLLVVDKNAAQGVNYHIAEIFLEEIRVFLPIPLETFHELLKPFFVVLERSSDRVLVNKVKCSVFVRLLENGAKYLANPRAEDGHEVDSGSEVEKLGKIALGLGLSGKLFESASSTDTVQGNRKVLFSLHEGFLKLEKDLANSGISISFSQENGGPEYVIVPVCSESTQQDVGVMVSADGSSDDMPSKKRKKVKKVSGRGSTKKSKRKKNGLTDSAGECIVLTSPNGGGLTDSAENLPVTMKEYGDSISFDETVISNLQKQFEKVAAEAGMTVGAMGASATPVITPAMKKRKRAKNVDIQVSTSSSVSPRGSSLGKSGDKSVKKVRFSLKNNLVWKPHNPLPPQSLRLPPSATPRGSALKKGVPPGPIRESPASKKAKVKANSVKKVRKSSKSVSPAVKRLRKLQSRSI
uniref:Ribosomal RNA processing protein 1 B n=1 Tax=Anthurium amnicola TaxID=1678845 RepID=A0A1D1XR63_9ARAE